MRVTAIGPAAQPLGACARVSYDLGVAVAARRHQLRAARLLDGCRGWRTFAGAPHLNFIFDEEPARLAGSTPFDELTRLAVQTEHVMHAYVRRFRQLRVHKVFLQSSTRAMLALIGFLLPDRTTGSRWDICTTGPGEFQLDKIQRHDGGAP